MTLDQAKWQAKKILGPKGDAREQGYGGRLTVREVGVWRDGVFIIKGSSHDWNEALGWARL